MPDVFLNALPMEHAIDSVGKLLDCGKYEVYIASTAPWDAPWVWMQKREWDRESTLVKNAYKRV